MDEYIDLDTEYLHAVAGPGRSPWFVDRELNAVGYSIYLGGYHLFCKDLSMPVFVPEPYVEFGLEPAFAISERIFDTRAEADAALRTVPRAARGRPIAYHWVQGATLVVPTTFTPVTAPRTVQTIATAVETLSSVVTAQLSILALSITGGMIVRSAATAMVRASANSSARPRPRSIPRRIRPVNGTINVGGGLEADAQTATNLNPVAHGTGGPGRNATIPNHVRGYFETIDEIFEPRSATRILSNRLLAVDANGNAYQAANWTRAAQGCGRVMAPGGRLALNIWTRTQADVDVLIRAFTNAGFRNVRNLDGVGAGTVIVGVR